MKKSQVRSTSDFSLFHECLDTIMPPRVWIFHCTFASPTAILHWIGHRYIWNFSRPIVINATGKSKNIAIKFSWLTIELVLDLWKLDLSGKKSYNIHFDIQVNFWRFLLIFWYGKRLLASETNECQFTQTLVSFWMRSAFASETCGRVKSVLLCYELSLRVALVKFVDTFTSLDLFVLFLETFLIDREEEFVSRKLDLFCFYWQNLKVSRHAQKTKLIGLQLNYSPSQDFRQSNVSMKFVFEKILLRVLTWLNILCQRDF